jgi:hypothetical protein
VPYTISDFPASRRMVESWYITVFTALDIVHIENTRTMTAEENSPQTLSFPFEFSTSRGPMSRFLHSPVLYSAACAGTARFARLPAPSLQKGQMQYMYLSLD